jgi:hypothetical protein
VASTGSRDQRSLPRRLDPELAPAFAKNPADEEFLDHLNAILAPHEEEDYRDLAERFPTLHVIGVPRSGTTLLYQAVVSGLDIGYVNNLVAAFWRAPVYGVLLSRKLGIDSGDATFESRYGRTDAVGEPHEFGYFWNAHLGYPNLRERGPDHEATIDFPHLAKIIRNMAEAAGGPIAFKPMLLVWHLDAMCEYLPLSCFVWIRRDHRATALSLLGMRRALFGSVEGWASLQPTIPQGISVESPAQQVAAQVLLLERTIERRVQRIGEDRVVRVSYDDLCDRPDAVLEQVRELLGARGHAPAWRDRSIRSFQSRPDPGLETEFGDEVDQALASLADDPRLTARIGSA